MDKRPSACCPMHGNGSRLALQRKKIQGFAHLPTSQEVVAVAIEHTITGDDAIVIAYRCHGFALMRGGSVKSIISEFFGRREGIACGSMHMLVSFETLIRELD